MVCCQTKVWTSCSIPNWFGRLALKDNSCFTQHNNNMWPTDNQSTNNNTFTFEEACAKQDMPTDQRTCTTYFCSSVWIHQVQFGPIHTVTFGYQYKLWKMNLASFSCSTHLTCVTKISSIDSTHYWPFAREYSIWNAAVAALQFGTEDLKPHILSDAIERVYTAFFC